MPDSQTSFEYLFHNACDAGGDCVVVVNLTRGNEQQVVDQLCDDRQSVMSVNARVDDFRNDRTRLGCDVAAWGRDLQMKKNYEN